MANDNWRADLVPKVKLKMVTLTYFVLTIKEHILKKRRVGLHLRKKLIERYEPSGKIWYFDSNVLNSYEKETTYTRFIC